MNVPAILRAMLLVGVTTYVTYNIHIYRLLIYRLLGSGLPGLKTHSRRVRAGFILQLPTAPWVYLFSNRNGKAWPPHLGTGKNKQTKVRLIHCGHCRAGCWSDVCGEISDAFMACRIPESHEESRRLPLAKAFSCGRSWYRSYVVDRWR